jgi:transcriptional/translational regulatory protein YebC/TACO1
MPTHYERRLPHWNILHQPMFVTFRLAGSLPVSRIYPPAALTTGQAFLAMDRLLDALGSDGSVAFLFKHCGQFVFAPGASEEKVMDAALEAGAEDVVANEDGSIEVLCPPNDFLAVKAALDQAGLKPALAEVTLKPTTEAVLAGSEAQRMRSLLDALESLDDVQDVYTTAVLEDA